jgi:hypothetical protein
MKPSEDVIVSPDTQRERRLPPGQSRTEKWPVLDASGPPARIGGLAARAKTRSLTVAAL